MLKVLTVQKDNGLTKRLVREAFKLPGCEALQAANTAEKSVGAPLCEPEVQVAKLNLIVLVNYFQLRLLREEMRHSPEQLAPFRQSGLSFRLTILRFPLCHTAELRLRRSERSLLNDSLGCDRCWQRDWLWLLQTVSPVSPAESLCPGLEKLKTGSSQGRTKSVRLRLTEPNPRPTLPAGVDNLSHGAWRAGC